MGCSPHAVSMSWRMQCLPWFVAVNRRQLRRFTSQQAMLFVIDPVSDNCQCQRGLQFKQQPDLFPGQSFPFQQSPLDFFHTAASLF